VLEEEELQPAITETSMDAHRDIANHFFVISFTSLFMINL